MLGVMHVLFYIKNIYTKLDAATTYILHNTGVHVLQSCFMSGGVAALSNLWQILSMQCQLLDHLHVEIQLLHMNKLNMLRAVAVQSYLPDSVLFLSHCTNWQQLSSKALLIILLYSTACLNADFTHTSGCDVYNLKQASQDVVTKKTLTQTHNGNTGLIHLPLIYLVTDLCK